MNADLSRRLAKITQSPLYMSKVDSDEANKQIIDTCVKAEDWDKLPERFRSFFEQCERSTIDANKRGYRYPFTAKELQEILYSETDKK